MADTVRGSRILIVEDEAIVALDLQDRLTNAGYAVVGLCATGRDALEHARCLNPDLVLLDIQLRGALTGVALGEKLREEDGPAVVFVTAHSDAETLEAASKADPVGYIVKPFDPRTLLISVEMGLRQNRARVARKRADNAKRETEARLAVVLEHSSDAIVSINESHEIVVFNVAAERLFGHSAAHALGQNLSLLLADDGHIHQGFVRAFAARGHDEVRGDNRLEVHGQHKDGTSIPLAISLSRSQLKGDGIYTAVIRDLTQERESAAAEMREQRLEATSRVAMAVVHDLNNLLSIISCMAYVIESDPGGVLDGPLEDLMDAVERGRTLSRRLLSVSRPTTPLTAGLNDTLAGLSRLVRHVIGPDIVLAWNVADGLATDVDAPRFEQLLVNLVVNAAEAMSDGGSLSVQARVETVVERRELLFGALVPGDYAVLSVQDSGPGLPPDTLAECFDAFVSTKTNGTGLGLATVVEVAAEHGAAIEVLSKPGHGARFCIHFPVRATIVATDAAATDKRILVVAKDSDTQRWLSSSLAAEAGYHVTAVTDITEANQRVRAGARFDAVVLDVAFSPNNNNSSNNVGPPGLIISAADTTNIAKSNYIILRKPFTVVEVCTEIERCLEQSASAS